jgi:hypothetical protein
VDGASKIDSRTAFNM